MLINFEHPSKKWLIVITLLVFQFEISGNDSNDEHPQNK